MAAVESGYLPLNPAKRKMPGLATGHFSITN
jgi:hypothetical protein